jgi:hypothetical protein
VDKHAKKKLLVCLCDDTCVPFLDELGTWRSKKTTYYLMTYMDLKKTDGEWRSLLTGFNPHSFNITGNIL